METKHLKTGHDDPDSQQRRPGLEIVLKCDSIGSLEAVLTALSGMTEQGEISIIYSSVGEVSKSDLLMAETGSRLIIGFQVGVLPGMDKLLREHHVEVRLYEVIYRLIEDMKDLARRLGPSVPGEETVGSAKVIALFKSTRKGIIIGCEVTEGHLAVGQHFRIISFAGPVFTGIIESMHVEDRVIQKATPGQKIGIKLKEFNKTRIGDIVESYKPLKERERRWQPSGEIIRK